MCCQDFRDGRWLLQLGMQHAPHQAADEVRLSAVAVYHLFIAAVQFFAAALLLLSQRNRPGWLATVTDMCQEL